MASSSSNTKLSKLDGSFAKKFDFSAAAKNRTGGTKLTTRSQANTQLEVPSSSKTRSNTKRDLGSLGGTFADFHKKKNVQFEQGPSARVQKRLENFQAHRRESRARITMEKRKIDPEIVAKSKANGNGMAGANTKEKSTTLNANRMEQLKKWKEEKAALQNKAKEKDLKPAFRVGVVRPVKAVVGTPIVPSKNEKNVNNLRTQQAKGLVKPAEVPKRTEVAPKRVPLPTQSKVLPQERRVTRAMAKQTPGGAIQPPIGKMEGLTLGNSKPGTTKSFPKVQATATSRTKMTMPTTPNLLTSQRGKEKDVKGGPIKSKEVIKSTAPATKSKETLKTNGVGLKSKQVVAGASNVNGQGSHSPQGKPPVPPPKPKPKKTKGMQFDDTYKEFNQVFMDACSSLQGLEKKWTPILAQGLELENEGSIPSDAQEEIQACIGRAKLLMESKLPQFAELLYFYLSRNQESDLTSGPVLPCDLEGWWAVAIIQVDNVKEDFRKLEILKKNGWANSLVEEVKTLLPQVPKKLKDSNEAELKQIKKVGPNKGLRAFLANARKQKKNDSISEHAEEEKSDEKKETTNGDVPVTPPNGLELNFEGGFFQIKSPHPKNFGKRISGASPFVARRSSRRISELQSKSQRASLTSNTPLKMLAVRMSMGSIAKLGINSGTYISNSPPREAQGEAEKEEIMEVESELEERLQ